MAMSSTERSRLSRDRQRQRARDRALAREAASPPPAPAKKPAPPVELYCGTLHPCLLLGDSGNWAARSIAEDFLQTALDEGAYAPDAATAAVLSRALGRHVPVAPESPATRRTVPRRQAATQGTSSS